MTKLERVARGLYAANLITAAERVSVRPPCDVRIRRAWEANPREQSRWRGVAEKILSEVPGIDLGAMTGEKPEPFLMACGRLDRQRRWVRIIDWGTIVLLGILSGIAGSIIGRAIAEGVYAASAGL